MLIEKVVDNAVDVYEGDDVSALLAIRKCRSAC